MASNSEANLSSDFDIDEVINWDEHNYSSKDIEFQLPSLGLPSDVKTSQNTTANHPSLPSTTVSSQQTTLSVTQNTNQTLYSTLFGAASNASAIRNSKSHGFATHQTMVSQLVPSFPSESLDIPPITPPSSNTSLLQFSSNILPVQDASLANQIRVQQLQSGQHTASMLSESVSPFTDDAMDDSDDFIEGPLDKIVDQIMERQLNEVIMKTSALSNTYGHHPVTVTNNNSMQNLITSPSISSVHCSTGNVTNPLSTIQSSAIQTVQKSIPTHSQSKFTLQSPGPNIGTNLGQTSVVRMPRNNMQSAKAVALQTTTTIEELLNMQKSVVSAVPKVEQNQFRNQSVPTSSLISSTVSAGRPTNTRIADGTKSMCVSLGNTSMLQANRTNSPNSELNRTINTLPQKLAFIPSVSSSAPKNVSAQVISNQGLDIQRSLSPQGIGNPATVQATTSQNISLVGNQTYVKSMQGSLQNLRSPGLQPSASLINQSTNNLKSLLMLQSQISSSKPNLTRPNIPPRTSQLPSNFSIFTIANTPNVSLTQSTIQKPMVVAVPGSSSTSSISTQNNLTVGAQPSIAGTTLKITSPSPNLASGFQLGSNISSRHMILNKTSPHLSTHSAQSPMITSLHTTLNKPSPRLATPTTVPPVTSNTHVFSNYQLSQALGSGSNTSKSSMVFALAPRLQGPATLKALPLTGKDKFAGRQIFLLQQPSQVTDQSKPQQVKIMFVNDGSVRQVVSGPQKSKEVSSSSPAIVSSQPAVQTVTPKATFTSPASTVNTVQVVVSPVPDTSEGSPSSVNSGDSDNLPIAVLKHATGLKTKSPDAVNKRGPKRKKDPNKPVKPLSSFQRFFQKTQATIRQQDPNAPFADVSKIAKQMWESLEAKEKKVYQEAWRTERAQYKKALEEYNASCLNESEMDGPSPKQLKHGQSSTCPVLVSPVRAPSSGMVHSLVSSPTVSVPSVSPVLLPLVSLPPVSLPPGFIAPVSSVSLSLQPVSSSTGGTSNTGMAAPRGGGKPLAMMVQLANKTKMASEQASGKTPGAAKWSKAKGPSNGVDDGLITHNTQITKKKSKINPIPKKLCVRESCNKTARTTKERGTLFCSNECIMMHCRGIFKMWVEARHGSLKATS